MCRSAVRQTVGQAKTDESFRLFTMPGMGHCYGGAGCDVFDKLAEIDQWVETGKAPERIIASKVQGARSFGRIRFAHTRRSPNTRDQATLTIPPILPA
jgi:hypothetical protein